MFRRDTFADLWGEMARVQDEFQRMFGRHGPQVRLARGTVPLVNVWEDEHTVHVELDLPGYSADKLDVQVTEGNVLTVTAERAAPEVKNAVWHRQERPAGQFSRALALPALVDADKVEARFELGVLKVTLPKSEAAKPRRITVKAD
jgi:HSP20 family protein